MTVAIVHDVIKVLCLLSDGHRGFQHDGNAKDIAGHYEHQLIRKLNRVKESLKSIHM